LWDTSNSLPLLCSVSSTLFWSGALGLQYGTWAAVFALPPGLFAVVLSRVNINDTAACGRSFYRNVYIGPLFLASILFCNWVNSSAYSIAMWNL
jgi:hypothetical protein